MSKKSDVTLARRPAAAVAPRPRPLLPLTDTLRPRCEESEGVRRGGVSAVLLALAVALVGLTARAADAPAGAPAKLGYTDTPMLPGGKWHVHDPDRPQPPAVDPGSGFPAEPLGKPPADAVVLFDGTDLAQWQGLDGQAPAWPIKEGILEVPVGESAHGGDMVTKTRYGDCQVHLEWATPDPPIGHVMNRGNSGVYFFGRYEVQLFDSYKGGIYADGQAAAIYGQCPPLVNASRKPGAWQSFDILFTAPRFQAGQLQSPAYVTLLHNGVCVHNHLALLGGTGHRIMPKYEPHEPKGRILLQAHGNPVRFRNLWVRELKGYDQP